MCRPDAVHRGKPTRLLVSLESYDFSKESSSSGDPKPSWSSFFLTGSLFLAFLVGTEQLVLWYLNSIQESHEVLQDETHRKILARHIGVDALSCFIVVILGWWARHLCKGPIEATILRRSGSMPAGGHEQRLFTYHPDGFRISTVFFFYQVKNLYDTIIWNDGPEFIFHHVFSLITAWGALSTCVAMPYTIFFFGLCEVSTGILCLLANFDDQHGVPGMGDAFPEVKVAIGALFVVFFILCRCILWPTYSYHFCKDVLLALKMNDSRTAKVRGWLRFFLVSLSGLSVLQVAWLGQIFVQAKEELIRAGFL